LSILTVIEVSGRSLGINQKGDREAERLFRIRTDSKTESLSDLRTATGLPNMFSAHPDDSGTVVVDIAVAQHEDDPFSWDVTLRYSSVLDNGEQDENPLNQPAVIEYGSAQFQKIAYRTINGEAVTNSAGTFFDPPVTIDDSRPVIRITKNKATFSASQAMAYRNAINTDAFLGIAPYCARVTHFGGVKRFKNVSGLLLPYWEVSLEIHVDHETWLAQVLDQGYYVRTGSTLEGKPIFNDIRYTSSGQSVAGPVMMDGNGLQLNDGATPVFLSFQVYRELPFAPLEML
jgi:hypothetical protein